MKKLLVFFALIFYNMNIISSPIDVNTARDNAKAFLYKNEMSMPYNATRKVSKNFDSQELTYVYSSTADNKAGYPMYHIFNRGQGNGFIISAGDNCIDDILAFSDNGEFDMDTAPDNLKWWLGEYERKMLFAIEHGIDIKHQKQLLNNTPDIAPLLECTWDQGTPFNDKCPLGNGNKRCYTGCIATALAQIMYYHKWPDYGNGYHEYQCPIDYDFSASWRGVTSVNPALVSSWVSSSMV